MTPLPQSEDRESIPPDPIRWTQRVGKDPEYQYLVKFHAFHENSITSLCGHREREDTDIVHDTILLPEEPHRTCAHCRYKVGGIIRDWKTKRYLEDNERKLEPLASYPRFDGIPWRRQNPSIRD